jgi:hypothetical protein
MAVRVGVVDQSFRATHGQASVEWMAVVALVATVLGLGAAVAQADAVGRRVTREMARALCLVRQGDCVRDREPCVVTADHKRHGVTVDLAFVRLGEGRMALVARQSDGTFAVTRSTEQAFGLAGHAGVGASVKVAGIEAALSAGVEASEVLTREGGKTWVVSSRAEAEALLRRLPLEHGLPPADVVYGMADLRSTVGASASGETIVSLDVAGAHLSFDRRTGQRVDRRTGRRTLFVRSVREYEATVRGGVLGLSGGAGDEVYAVQLDADGRPLDLQIMTTGAFAGSRDLPDVVQPVAGMLEADADGERVYEVTAHLDLTDAGNLAAAEGLLDALTRGGPYVGRMPAASQALRRRIDERGTVEARVLAMQSSSKEVGLGASLGGKLGGMITAESRSSRLLAAMSRGLDGQWLARGDCVKVARG